MATRMLKVTKKVSGEVITAIDDSNILGLKTPFDRCDLFIIAMALGVESGKKYEMFDKGTALVRESSVNDKNNAMMTSLLIDELQGTNELDKLSDKDMTYSLAQDYANKGFEILMDKVKRIDNKDSDEESLIWDMIDELDRKYEELFCEN